MPSFRQLKDDRRRMFLALVGSVEGQLREAYAKRQERGLDTQASLAAKLGVDRSVIHRRLNGAENMTLRTVADLVWALDHCVSVEIFDPADKPDRNDVVRSAPRVRAVTLSSSEWPEHQAPTVKVRSETKLVPQLVP